MPPDLQLIFGGMTAAIAALFAALMLVYRDALAEAREQNKMLRTEIVNVLSAQAIALESLDSGQELVTEYVRDKRAEERSEARARRLNP